MNEASNCVAFSRQGAVSTGTHAVAPHVGLDFAAGTYSPWPAKDHTCRHTPCRWRSASNSWGRRFR